MQLRTTSAVAVCRCNCTFGYLLRKEVQISASVSTASYSPQPMVTQPSTNSRQLWISSTVFSSSSKISKARRFSRMPSLVNVIFLLFRSKSGVPSSSSSAAICLESVGCVICSASAALVMFCSLATVKKYLRIRISMVPSYLSSTCSLSTCTTASLQVSFKSFICLRLLVC